MSAPRCIDARDLQLALYAGRGTRRRGAPRFAATTRALLLPLTCHDRVRGHTQPASDRLSAGFAAMDRGGIRHVIERTRRLRGCAEVQRTWGTGYRALMVEPLDMRAAA